MDTRPGPGQKDDDRGGALHGAARARVSGPVRIKVSPGIHVLARAASMGSRAEDRGSWATGAGIDLLTRVDLPLGAGPSTTAARLRAALKYPLFPP